MVVLGAVPPGRLRCCESSTMRLSASPCGIAPSIRPGDTRTELRPPFRTGSNYEQVEKGSTFRFGSGQHTTDFLSDIAGVTFEEAYKRADQFEYNPGNYVPIIGKQDLIKNKESTGRAKDKADAVELKK